MSLRCFAFVLALTLASPAIAQDADGSMTFHHIVKGRIDHDNVSRVCPDHWVVNRMPGVMQPDSKVPEVPRAYLIIHGKRVETTDVDMNWIKANCAIQPETVW